MARSAELLPGAFRWVCSVKAKDNVSPLGLSAIVGSTAPSRPGEEYCSPKDCVYLAIRKRSRGVRGLFSGKFVVLSCQTGMSNGGRQCFGRASSVVN